MAADTKTQPDLSKEQVDNQIAGMEDQFPQNGNENDYMSRGTQDAEDYANQNQDKDQSKEGQSHNPNDLRKKAQDAKNKIKDAKNAAQGGEKAAAKGGEKIAEEGAKQVGKRAAQEVGKEGVKRGAQAVAAGATSEIGGFEGVVAVEAVDQGRQSAVAVGKALTGDVEALGEDIKKKAKYAFVLWLIGALFFGWPIFLLLIVVFIIVGIFLTYNAQQAELTTTPLTLTKTGPTTARAGDVLNYTITVGYPSAYQEITVNDQIPTGTVYVGSNQKVTCDNGACNAASKIITWKATTNNVVAPVTATYTITLKATVDNNYVVNMINGTAVASIDAGTAPGGNIPASTTACGMPEYQRYMNMTPDHLNYGDPACTYIKTDPNGKKIFDKDTLLTMLKQQDPTRANQWFCLANPESGYNPNAYLGNSTSGRGAYGLYQMNPGGGAQYDNGKVVWTLQISNAINYNNGLIAKGNIWDYWDPRSRARCGI